MNVVHVLQTLEKRKSTICHRITPSFVIFHRIIPYTFYAIGFQILSRIYHRQHFPVIAPLLSMSYSSKFPKIPPITHSHDMVERSPHELISLPTLSLWKGTAMQTLDPANSRSFSLPLPLVVATPYDTPMHHPLTVWGPYARQRRMRDLAQADVQILWWRRPWQPNVVESLGNHDKVAVHHGNRSNSAPWEQWLPIGSPTIKWP